MIQLSGRFLKYNIIDKNGVQFPKSATIKIPSKVFVLFNFDKSHPIGIAEVIKDEEGLLAGIDDVLGVLKDDKVGCGGYYRAVKSHMEYGIKVIDSSYNQTRNVMLNYEVLANIYRQRKNHKLDEWREVCKWIESLPYSELITVDSREAIKEEVWKEIIKVREIPDPWEVHGTAEYAKMCPDQLITIAEMEADARRAIPADKIKTGSKED